MKMALIALGLLTLAACGADGPPVAPGGAAAPAPTTTGISLSGTAKIGISGSL